MPGLLVNEGEAYMLTALVTTGQASSPLRLALFKNDITPSSAHTLANYVEATFTGYSAATLPSTGWALAVSAVTIARADPVTFTCTAATSEPIYGYVIKTSASSGLICSERFSDGPYVMALVNDSIRVTPRIGLSGT